MLTRRMCFVARGSYNVLDESAVGFIMTHGDPASNDNNSVIGADFLYRNSDGPFGQIILGNFWAQQSDTTSVSGDNRAYGARVEMPGDKVHANVSFQQIEENFDPALGFVNRQGIRRYGTGARYRIRPENGIWRAINIRGDYILTTDMAGERLSERILFQPFGLYSHTDDYIFVELIRSRELVGEDFNLFDRLNVPAGDYEFDRYWAELRTGMQRPFRVVLGVGDGEFFGGNRLEKFVELQWRQSAHFAIAANFTENVVDLPSGSFTSHLASLRTDVAFNSKWSWSSFLQYDNSAEKFGVNSRVRYMPEAGQEMLLVLNHGGTVDAANRTHSAHSDLNLKLTYTFRY